MATALTARQAQILELIQQSLIQTGFPPTRAEIAQQLGFKSTNAAEDHLKALARKGFIEMKPGASRGIRVTHAGDQLRAQTNPTPASAPRTLMEHAQEVFDRMTLPLVGRVAAGSPILAQENIDREIAV